MKKFVKNNVKLFVGILIGAIVFGTIGVYAAIKIQSSEIGYKDGTVEDALDDLYTLAGNANLTKYAELQSSFVTNAGATSVTFNNVPVGNYVLLTARTTGYADSSSSMIGRFNIFPSDVTTSITLDGDYSEIDDDTVYIIHVNNTSNVIINSSTVFSSTNQGGYLYARLYEIN